MAAGRSLLIAALSLLLPALALGAPRPSCLKCHPEHYRDRGTCVGCHKGDPRSDRLRIAHHGLVVARFSWYTIPGSQPLERGNKLLERFACRRCHTTAGKGNRLTSNLDRLPAGTTPDGISASIQAPALAMPNFRLAEGDITDLVNAILAGSSRSAAAGKETPQVVHFETGTGGRENIFDKKCGPCHKVLTTSRGALGKGEIGPNLSGLLTEHYPPTWTGNRRWSGEILEKWLKNPRECRPVTQMRPVPLQKEELEALTTLLSADETRKVRP